jgi:hypothetical protein
METREDLRDELIVMLQAARELTPDTDRWLAERFLDRLDRRTHPAARPRRSRPRASRRRLAAWLLAGLALAIGTPLSFRASQEAARQVAPQPLAARPVPACWWNKQTLSFASLPEALSWEKSTNPRAYQVLGSRNDASGETTLDVLHWTCR